jgi:hypothetical protein
LARMPRARTGSVSDSAECGRTGSRRRDTTCARALNRDAGRHARRGS